MSFLNLSFHQSFAGHGKWEQYLGIYEYHFRRFVDGSPTILELGVGNGNSLLMWRMLFGANATIVGIDTTENIEVPPTSRSRVYVGQQQDVEFLEKVYKEIGTPDIVIDDACHEAGPMLTSFEFFYPKMSKHGVYLVEDLHAADARGFFEKAKELTNELTVGISPKMTDFAMHTVSIHFYDSVVVFERGVPKERIVQDVHAKQSNKDPADMEAKVVRPKF